MKKYNNIKEKYSKLLFAAREAAVILLAAVSIAVGMELFFSPGGMNAGGFLGIAQIIALWVPEYLYLGIIYVVINIPVLVLAVFFFSKKFVVKTAIVVLITGAAMIMLKAFDVFDRLGLAAQTNITLISIAGGALIALGIAFVLSGEGSAGGTDIIALMVQKKRHIANVTRLFLVFDLVVIAIYSVVVGSLSSFFYSVTALFAYQITLELVFGSFGNAIMFEIVTDDSSAVIKAIEEELDRGSTMFKAVGTYTKNTKEVVMCVVRRRQEAKARELVKKIAPDSFAYTIPIKEVIGKGFRNVNF